MNAQEFWRDFRVNFPDMGEPADFLDHTHSLATRQPHLDVVRLDEALIAKHGAYEGSMLDFVTGHYGKAAAEFLAEAA